MKVYKVELLIIDHDRVGVNVIIGELENTKYSNRCMFPHVMYTEEKEIEEWYNEHPLNYRNQMEEEYNKLFNEEITKLKEDKRRLDWFIENTIGWDDKNGYHEPTRESIDNAIFHENKK